MAYPSDPLARLSNSPSRRWALLSSNPPSIKGNAVALFPPAHAFFRFYKSLPMEVYVGLWVPI
jgi:hypothetical protein